MTRPQRPELKLEECCYDSDVIEEWEKFVDELEEYADRLEWRIEEPVTRVYIDTPDMFEFAYEQMVVKRNPNVRIKTIVFSDVNTRTVGPRLKELTDRCPNGRVEEVSDEKED